MGGQRERKLGQVRRQRNMFQWKEQDKIPEELNKTNTSYRSDKIQSNGHKNVH